MPSREVLSWLFNLPLSELLRLTEALACLLDCAPARSAARLPGPVRRPVRAQSGDVVRRPPAERTQDRGPHPAAARGGAAGHRAAVQGAPVPVQHARGRQPPLAAPFGLGEAAALPPQVTQPCFS